MPLSPLWDLDTASSWLATPSYCLSQEGILVLYSFLFLLLKYILAVVSPYDGIDRIWSAMRRCGILTDADLNNRGILYVVTISIFEIILLYSA